MSWKRTSTRAFITAWVLGAAAGCPGAPATPGDDGGESGTEEPTDGGSSPDAGGVGGDRDSGSGGDGDGDGGSLTDGGAPGSDGGDLDDGGTPELDLGLGYYLPSHDVRATYLDGTTLYVGGMFNRMQADVGPFAAVTADDGALVRPIALGPQLTGTVSGAAPLPDGSAIVVGNFMSTSTPTIGGIAKVGPDGNVDLTWVPDSGSGGMMAAADADAIYVAQLAWGSSASFLHKVDLETGERTPWEASFANSGPSNAYINIRAMKVVGERLFIAGDFSGAGGEVRPGIAAFDKEGNLDTAFAPTVPQLTVNAIEVMGNTLLVGGDFSVDDGNGGTRVDLLGLDLETGALTEWAPRTTGVGWVNALAVDGERVFVGGQFAQFNGEWQGTLVAVDAAGALTDWRWPVGDNPSFPWGPVVGHVTSLLIKDGIIYAGGGLAIYDLGTGEVKSNNAFAADLATGELLDWDPSPSGLVKALVPLGAHVGVGGLYRAMGGEPRNGAAAIDLVTGALLPFNPLAGRPGSPAVYDIEPRGDALVLAGYLGSGDPPELVVADPVTGAILDEIQIAGVEGGGTTEIAFVGDETCVTGNTFVPINSPSPGKVVCIDGAGDVVFEKSFNNYVWTLAEFEGDLLVGGAFTNADGAASGPLVRMGADGQLRDWAPNIGPIPDLTGYGAVTSLAIIDGVIYVGGDIVVDEVWKRIVSVNADASLGDFVVEREQSASGTFTLKAVGDELLAAGRNIVWVYSPDDVEPVRTWELTEVAIPYGVEKLGELIIVGGSSFNGGHLQATIGVP